MVGILDNHSYCYKDKNSIFALSCCCTIITKKSLEAHVYYFTWTIFVSQKFWSIIELSWSKMRELNWYFLWEIRVPLVVAYTLIASAWKHQRDIYVLGPLVQICPVDHERVKGIRGEALTNRKNMHWPALKCWAFIEFETWKKTCVYMIRLSPRLYKLL